MQQHNNSNDNSNPLISIVMPAYNSEKTVSKSIESVLKQTFNNWELIIIDDASNDQTAEIVSDKFKDTRIKLIRNATNLGPANARNIGLDGVKGTYVAFLDADDFWANEKLEIQVSFMQKKGCAISYTTYWRVNESASRILNKKTAAPQIGYAGLLNSNGIGCLTAMFDRHKLPNIRFVDPSDFLESEGVSWLLKHYLQGRVGHEDYVFWLSVLRPTMGQPALLAYGIEQSLAFYRVSTDSFSGNKVQAAIYQWFIYRHVEKLPFWKSIKHFSRYALLGLLTQFRSRSK